MAKIISVANGKSGMGKTTVTNLFSITCSLPPLDLKVLVVDATEDKGLAYLSVLQENETYEVLTVECAQIPQLLSIKNEEYDLIFLDLPTSFEVPGLKTALLCLDLLIVPTAGGLLDQLATKQFLDHVEEVAKVRKAKGYPLNVKMLASKVDGDGDELLKVWNRTGLDYYANFFSFDYGLADRGQQFGEVIDYVTDGASWEEDQQIFHELFLEFNTDIESL